MHFLSREAAGGGAASVSGDGDRPFSDEALGLELLQNPAMTGYRVFLLSPASCAGERARLVFNERARFDLAVRLRSPEGAALGDVFSFLSGLYFRGKLAYARAFAAPPPGAPGVLVITPNEGLLTAEELMTVARLRRFAKVSIDASQARYRRPLARQARALAVTLDPDCEVVLLGSIATGKYVDILGKAFGDRLRFPGDFVGRGDMSRGGLLLRCVREGRELAYRPVAGGKLHGKRPPKLARLRPPREMRIGGRPGDRPPS